MTSLKNAIFGKSSFTLIEYANNKIIFNTDANINETYNKSSSISAYPKEDGGEVGNNAQVNSFAISISAVTSDASLSYIDILNGSAIGGSFLGGLASEAGFNVTSKSQKAWDLSLIHI